MRKALFERARVTPCKGKVFALRECCNRCCRNERIRVARNVAPDVASNVAAGKCHRVAWRVALGVAANVANVKRLCVLNVAFGVASLLRWPFTNLLPLPLTSL
jgi:hypothetical protein